MYGAFVRQIRQSRNLSQRQLADVSGVSQPNISAIEHDRRLPSVDTLNRLLLACGYELAAAAGDKVIYAPLPKGEWFPDSDLPPSRPDDPPDEAPTVDRNTPMADRARIITAILDASARR